jgi:hypothetical protein
MDGQWRHWLFIAKGILTRVSVCFSQNLKYFIEENIKHVFIQHSKKLPKILKSTVQIKIVKIVIPLVTFYL